MLRAGMDPDEIQEGLKICHSHRKNLGQYFYRKIHGQACHYPHHAGEITRFSEGTRMYKIDYQRSLKALRDQKNQSSLWYFDLQEVQ